MLSTAAIRNLFDENFLGGTPEEVSGLRPAGASIAQWVSQLVERFKKIDRVSCYPYWQVNEDSKYAAIKLIIAPPENTTPEEKSTKQQPESFLLTVNCRVFTHRKNVTTRRGGSRNYVDVTLTNQHPRNGLWIVECSPKRCDSDTAAAVEGFEDLEAFIDTIKSFQTKTALRHAKKLKVTGFRQHGLLAQLNELSHKHAFQYCLGHNARDVNLSVRVRGPRTKKQIEYHIAFVQTKFDGVLNRVPDLIKHLEQLADLGIALHSDNRKWKGLQSGWLTKPTSVSSTLFPLE